MVEFSKELITEYQREMSISYGLSVSDSEAQIQLLSLVYCLFPSLGSLADDGNKVGDSITPTSGHK